MSGVAGEYRDWRYIDYRPALLDVPTEHLARYLRSGQRGLEIGCNRGRTASWLASHGVDVVGIDINAEAVSHAREEIKRLPNVNISFIEGDFLDQSDLGTFDLVVMIRVLTCFARVEDWQALLKRSFDCLADDGLMYIHDFIMAPAYTSYSERYKDGARRGWRAGNFSVPAIEGGTLFVAHHHTMEEMTEMTKPYEELFLNFHDSVSLNGHTCRMFEFLGKRRAIA
jgi:cyclopropane fatty-acyl-phospholipid synthase-like methyltransferase